MKAGKLDRRVVIETFTPTQNTLGEETRSWSTWKTVWAALFPVQGNEQFEADRLTEKVDFKMRMRYIAGLLHTMRVSYGGNYYDIVSINEIDRKEGYEVFIRLHKDMA